jgi:hypothetical protein
MNPPNQISFSALNSSITHRPTPHRSMSDPASPVVVVREFWPSMATNEFSAVAAVLADAIRWPRYAGSPLPAPRGQRLRATQVKR